MKDIGKKLLLGSGMRFLSLLVMVSISFIMMPYLIRTLTDHWYGLWTVIASLMGFYGLLDLGISSATQRYISKAMPRNDHQELNSIVSTSLAIFSVVGFIAFCITLIIALMGGYFFSVQEELVAFRWVVIISGSGIALNFLFWVLFGVITSNLRYDMMEYIQIIKNIIRALLFYVFLEAGYSIIAMALITVLLDLAAYIILLQFAKKIAPWLKISFKYIDKKLMPELFNFGKFSFLITICEQLRKRTDNFLIPIYLSLSHVTHYAIAIQICNYFTQALISLVSVSMPVYAKLYAEKNYAKLAKDFMRDTRIAAIFCCLGYGAIILVSEAFISMWLGPEYLDAFIPLIILAFSIFLMGIQLPAVNLKMAMNKHSLYSYMCVFEIICNIPITLLLLPKYGLTGAAIGTVLPLLFTRLILQPILVFRIIDINPIRYYFEIIKVIFILFILHAIPYFILQTHVTIDSYFILIIALMITYPPILLLIYLFLLKPEEKEFVSNLIGRKVSN